jgi:hypothetical protein
MKAFLICLFVSLTAVLASATARMESRYAGDGSDLQAVVEALPDGAVLRFQSERLLTLTQAVVLRRPVTLIGLRARLPDELGGVSLVEVRAEGVRLFDLDLQGNYRTVPQSARAPLVYVTRGGFIIERVRLREASKEGINVTAEDQDVVGGLIRDIRGEGIGRDCVGLSGGNGGLKVRNVVIENVVVHTSHLRGAVEVSDGTANIVVRGIEVSDAMYAVDIQDHRGASAANTNILVENVRAADGRYLIRTDNSPRGHAGLVLRNIEGTRIAYPMALSHTANVLVENVVFREPLGWGAGEQAEALILANCQNVLISRLRIEGHSGPPVVRDRYLGEAIAAGDAVLQPSAPAPATAKDRAALLAREVAAELTSAIAEDRHMSAQAARRAGGH